MGRHFEVRAAAMAASAKAKSAIYMRASKEIYAAAKSGEPDPNSNLALRAAIEKYRKQCPKDVIERAIEKAKGGDAVAYIQGRYEFMGPGGSEIIVEDDGSGYAPSDDNEQHTALKNIRQRLEMMCGGKLTITPREGSGTVVTVTIPAS
jgi:transcriptional/translational regulatory protein YebC/TACO1